MKKYKCLNKQLFVIDEYQLVPIRYKDRFKIMKWRNDQIYHLRQRNILTKSKQNLYFGNVVNKITITRAKVQKGLTIIQINMPFFEKEIKLP